MRSPKKAKYETSFTPEPVCLSFGLQQQIAEKNCHRAKALVFPLGREYRHGLATLVLDERGMIRDCSKAGEQLFGYRHDELAWQHISKLFPQLLDVQLVHNGRFNPRLEFLCHCGLPFRGQNQQGSTFDSELHFIHLDHGDRRTIRLIVRSSCDAVMQHSTRRLAE